ncbi:integrase [Halioglobus maricola]|uniref:Integrase n=1 Tax=Halioglobus maricola TaxID=2601894 RepID=A0A5P9NN11_9GAMM|nr:tyrosine-type recombinase/integrase [Halioglobus maricola]QFU77177.1 integrase [Halioglobus maricola]
MAINESTSKRTAWNRGLIIGQKRPLKLRDIWEIRIRLKIARSTRNLAMFNLALDSKLRGCDLVGLLVGDIAQGGKVASRATVMQRKTQRPVQFEITPSTRDSLTSWIREKQLRDCDYLFPSRNNAGSHISIRQYARLTDNWFRSAGLDTKEYGTHSLRRTKPSMIYKRTGNLRAIQLLLGHTKLESTIRYLGVDMEDALELSEQTEI